MRTASAQAQRKSLSLAAAHTLLRRFLRENAPRQRAVGNVIREVVFFGGFEDVDTYEEQEGNFLTDHEHKNSERVLRGNRHVFRI